MPAPGALLLQAGSKRRYYCRSSAGQIIREEVDGEGTMKVGLVFRKADLRQLRQPKDIIIIHHLPRPYLASRYVALLSSFLFSFDLPDLSRPDVCMSFFFSHTLSSLTLPSIRTRHRQTRVETIAVKRSLVLRPMLRAIQFATN